MADALFTLSFDQRSLSEIALFAGFAAFLTEDMRVAMQKAGDLITAAAQANTETAFKNPTGALSDSIAPVVDSPFEVQVGVGVPYGHRLEVGFHGADSLGRVYDEAGEPYLSPALEANKEAVLLLVEDAVIASLTKMGAV